MIKIAVLVKEVPDTWSDRRIDPGTKRVDRDGDVVIDEINEKAVEAALQVKESGGGEVTAVTMGPKNALDAVRKALAMGADAGIHIIDEALGGSDALQTSAALAAALGSRGFDLVIAGNESTDGRTAAVPAMLAERLGLSQATFLRTLTVKDGTVTGERMTDDGHVEVRASLPALVSVTEQIAEARFPNFKGIMAAKKKPVETLGLAELGIAAGDAGGANSWSVVETVAAKPPREGGTIIKDDGTAGQKLADYLASAKLI
ncbi:electron transfer flavoprotein beta subunit [Cryobacterium mesophilum]|uniref:Electron transfer flavoprotein subunit beta n=1 Tax=Terrimesophilobacter mesophilus TaxID=433647 RepID=A0A4R8VAZ8_9MICO|nr:electron transfer flavoprotein subunit beta/FixA family protein [Terrimesophilobacter mesophilus]MBB5632714.1 electron transfer flavoprotein beta subunit [Terrimesophilobacter mesophilus]TFB79516.1 electron transfer flavoprotein beta subunit/FixA family protein [Terrimesophilobacter mesophilus]